MRNANFIALSASDAGASSGIQIDANQIISISFQPVFKDTAAAGTLQVQMSNDITTDRALPGSFTVTNWSNIPNATSTVTAGVGAPITIAQSCYRWLRVIYTGTTPGTSTIVVTANSLSV